MVKAEYHPHSVLLTDRRHVFSVDIRSGSRFQQGMELERKNLDYVRHIDSDDDTLPNYYVMTDQCLRVCDVRQTGVITWSGLDCCGGHEGQYHGLES